jgi:uncharacterized protein
MTDSDHFAIMSPNKKVVETFMTSLSNLDRGAVLSCLAEDIVRVEWADGFPTSGVPITGKAAFSQNIGETPTGEKLQTEIARMTEENNVVVAEGLVRVPRKEGGFVTIRFCDVFEMESGKVKRLDSFTAEVKDSAR